MGRTVRIHRIGQRGHTERRHRVEWKGETWQGGKEMQSMVDL